MPQTKERRRELYQNDPEYRAKNRRQSMESYKRHRKARMKQMREWQAKNQKYVLAYRKRYCKENQQKRAAYMLAWRAENRERLLNKGRANWKKLSKKINAERRRNYKKNRAAIQRKRRAARTEADRRRDRDHARLMRQTNGEHINRLRRLHREKHPEKHKKWENISKAKRLRALLSLGEPALEDRRAKWREYMRNYKIRFPEKVWSTAQKRRALQRKATIGDLSKIKAYIRTILIATEFRCAYCGESVPPGRNRTVDHKRPITRGGKHTAGNLVPACRRCNCSKNDRTVAEFRRYLKLVQTLAKAA